LVINYIRGVKKLLLLALMGSLAFAGSAQLTAGFTANIVRGCAPLNVTFTNTSTGTATSCIWSFGNGNTSTLMPPAAPFAIYNDPGVYTVTLKMYNGTDSSVTTKTAYINVFANPVANFTVNKTGGCNPDTFCFTDLSQKAQGTINKWEWDFSDGNPSSLKNPCHVYTFADTFKVSLTVTDSNGCRNSVIKDNLILVTQGQNVSFTNSSPVFSCDAPLTVTFGDSTWPVNGGYSYNWDFGDGQTSTLKNPPPHVYTHDGIYTPTLMVTSPNGCVKKFSKNALVEVGKPKPDFTVSANTGCRPLAVNFTNTTNPAPSGITFKWSTSDSQSSVLANPTFVFTNTGNVTVKLVYVTDKGCRDSLVKVAATVLAPPTANFDVQPNRFCKLPATATFTDNSTGAVSWFWQFSDNTTSTQKNPPPKTFTAFGVYSARLTVVAANGCRDSILMAKAVEIKPSDFTIELQHRKGKCKPSTINWNVTDESVVPFTTWNWNFAGLGTSNQRSPSFTFNDTGVFVVTVTASNDDGCIVTKTDTVRVGMKTNVDFIADPQEVCASDGRIRFTNKSVNNIKPISYEWDYGGAGTLVDTNRYKYAGPGKYSVKLTAWHYNCATDTVKKDYITVFEPVAKFDLPVLKCANDSLLFEDKSIGGTRWTWKFGNGDSSNKQNTKYQYPQDGLFPVTLIVYDSSTHCVDSITKMMAIPESPKLRFWQSDSIGCRPLKITFIDSSVVDSPYAIFNWRWDFGDGQQFQRPAPGFPGSSATVTFNNGGYISAAITIRDTRNCTYTLKKDSAIYVYQGNVKIGAVPPLGCIPLNVSFTDSSYSEFPITNRKWLWGTGDSSTTPQPQINHVYSTVPENQNDGYRVTLVINDSMGCTYNGSRLIYPTKAIPNFSFTMAKYCGRDSIKFTAGPNINYNFGSLQYRWSFGDGSQSLVANPRKAFAGDTTLPVQLVLRDANNCIDSVTKLVRVNATPPRAGFLGNPNVINCPPGKVVFHDTTVQGGSPIVSWEWNFGDTRSFLSDTPSKVYITPGVYPARLKVIDSVGCVDSSDQPGYIIVKGPVGSYDFFPKKGCSPLDVKLVANSPNAEKFIWDLANGLKDSTSGPEVHYSYEYRVASYHPFLTLVDSNGCPILIPTGDSIVVYPLPTAEFQPSLTVICKDRKIYFANTSVRSVNNIPLVSWQWSFGTGDSSSLEQPPAYKYISGGAFGVSLKITDSLGCTSTKIIDSLIVVIDDTIPPATPLIFRATVEDNETVLLQHSRNPEVDLLRYTIFGYDAWGNMNTLDAVTDREDTNYFHTGLNTLSNTYSYNITATDVCLNESPPGVKNTTVELKAVGVINAIRLDWTPYIGWDSVKSYEVYRLNPDSAMDGFVHIATVGRDTLDYTDTNIICYKPFFYRIRSIQDSGWQQFSWSDTSGAVPIFQTTVPGTRNIRATVVNDKSVLLEWRERKHKLPFTYLIYRMTDDDPNPIFIRELTEADTFMLDHNVDVDAHAYTYITYLKDNCGGLSPISNIAKTILLKADLEENDIFKHDPIITWSNYEGWSTGVESYKGEFYYDSLENFATVVTRDSATRTFFHKYVNLVQRDYCYRVTAYQFDSNFIWSESNVACIPTAPRLFVPNVFTINGDNLNDKFVLGGVFLDTYNLKIFSRWGELLFESYDIQDSWDGTFRGQPCKPDVYVYMAEATGRKGQRFVTKGNVTLLR
jgi:gliding motility-associated-like protein